MQNRYIRKNDPKKLSHVEMEPPELAGFLNDSESSEILMLQ
jgi:hypothetical protein